MLISKDPENDLLKYLELYNLREQMGNMSPMEWDEAVLDMAELIEHYNWNSEGLRKRFPYLFEPEEVLFGGTEGT